MPKTGANINNINVIWHNGSMFVNINKSLTLLSVTR